MALVRYTEFYDLLDRLIRVEIHDTTFAGVASEFKTFKPGAVIASSKFNQTPTDLIKGTSCTIFFKVEDGTDKTFITGIVGAHEEQYVCVVYIDSVFEFAGYILTDLCSIEAGTYPYVAELTATEGLSRLTDVDMLDSGSLYTGKLTVLEAFIECLSKIGTQTYWPVSASDDWIHTSVDWWEANHPSRANNIDPLAYTRFDATVFLETRQTDDGQIQVQLGDDGLPKPRKVSDVLFDLCRCWDVRLYLARGTWHIEQVNLLDETDIPYRAYDTTGSLSGSGTFKPRKTVDCDIIKPLTDGEYTFHAPVLKVTARRAHQSNYNLLSTRTLPFDTDLDETVIGTLATGANNTVSVSGRMWLRWAGVAGTVLFYTGVKVTIRLTDGVDDYYLDGSDWNSQNVYTAGNRRNYTAASWQQYATSYYCWYPGMKGSANGFLYVPIDIITPDLPISGQVSVEIDFIIEKDRYLYTSGYDIPGSYIYRLENLTCIYNEGTAANYTAIEILNTTDGTTPVTDTRSIDLGDIRFGDGVNAVSLGAFEVSQDALTWVASALWHEGTSGENYAMLELLCREVLARQRLASRIFTSTIHGGQICHEDVLTYDNLVWMSAAVNVDLHDDMARGEWVAIGKDRQYIKDNFTTNLIAPRLDVVPAVDYSDTKTRNASFTYAGVATRGGSQLTASYDAGDVLTVLAVADLGFDMLSGAKIHVVNPYTGEYQTFTTDDDYVSGGTEIPVDTTAAIDLPVGSFVVVDVSAVMANAGGGAELWTRTGTVLSPTTANDSVEVTTTSVAALSGISSNNYGVYGAGGSSTAAIYGLNSSTGPGVWGQSTGGYGVRALSTNNYGVYAVSTNNHAIYGTASASGMNGVYGISTLSHGVYGSAAANNMAGVFGIGTAVGVKGTTTNGIGVYGESTGGVGVYAYSTNNFGIQAGSANSTGGQISSSTNVGLTVAAYGASTALFTIRENATTNTILQALVLTRSTTGTAANGIGESIEFSLENAGGNVAYRGSIEHSLNDATAGSEDSNFTFYHSKAGAKTEICYMGYDATTLTEAVRVPYLYAVNGAYTDGVIGFYAVTSSIGIYGECSGGNGVFGKSTGSGHGVVGVTTDTSYYGLAANTAAVGDYEGDDYAQFDDVGHFTLHGRARVYIDMLNELVGKRITSAASAIEIDDPEIRLEFKTSCELTDYVSMNIQLNHMRCLGTPVYPHLHWEQASATMPNWLLQYRWQYQGSAKTTGWTYLPWVDNAFSWTTGTLNQITTFGSITPNNDGHSDILQFRVIRDVDNDSGEFGDADGLDASAYALMFDVHVVVDKLGSASEYSDTEEGTTTTTTA